MVMLGLGVGLGLGLGLGPGLGLGLWLELDYHHKQNHIPLCNQNDRDVSKSVEILLKYLLQISFLSNNF